MELPGSDDSFSIASLATAGSSETDEIKLKDRKLSLLEQKLVEMVLVFKISVADASDRFYNEFGRKNYVTPTSYLEMLRSFKILYKKTFLNITMQRDRYTTGLEKLEFAAGQVAVMQKKLQDLQPQLKVSKKNNLNI
jgi:dynein heavy chain